MRRPPRRAEQGYALVAAVASIVVFAGLSLMMLQATRGSIVMASAESTRARLLAATQAGVALSVQELLQPGAINRVPIDGTPRTKRFAGYTLMIAIEDERGKIALNLINADQARAMFAAFGVQGPALDQAVDGFLDWRDEDDDARPNGAEIRDYANAGQRPRNGPLLSVGELALIRGVGPGLAARIAPYATLTFGTRGEFDPRFASAIARSVLAEKADEPETAAFGTDDAGARPIEALQVFDRDSLRNRPLTIRVVARDGQGGRAERRVVVELTGAANRPYVVRSRD